jgi:hypothetical protein
LLLQKTSTLDRCDLGTSSGCSLVPLGPFTKIVRPFSSCVATIVSCSVPAGGVAQYAEGIRKQSTTRTRNVKRKAKPRTGRVRAGAIWRRSLIVRLVSAQDATCLARTCPTNLAELRPECRDYKLDKKPGAMEQFTWNQGSEGV